MVSRLLTNYLVYNLMFVFVDIILAAFITFLIWFFLGVMGGMELNTMGILRWSYIICLALSVIGITATYFVQAIIPARKCMKKNSVSFLFALEHFDKSQAFIKFIQDEPKGYAPWGKEEFLRQIKDERVLERYPEARSHPDFLLRGREFKIFAPLPENVSNDALRTLIGQAEQAGPRMFLIRMTDEALRYCDNGTPIYTEIDFLRSNNYQTLDELLEAVERSPEWNTDRGKAVRDMVRTIRTAPASAFFH